MKAMDKDRDRRYATANDLAADVERYLHDEPVQACPPSAAYRFTKFARRNQAALVTSGLVALALIAGTGVSVWQAIRATNAELAAITERDEKVQLALRATNAEQRTAQALLTAQERLQFGRQAVDEMYTQVAEKWLAQQAELTLVQKQFLEKALAFYQRLATEESARPGGLVRDGQGRAARGRDPGQAGAARGGRSGLPAGHRTLRAVAREAQDSAKYNQGLAKTHDAWDGCCSSPAGPWRRSRNNVSRSRCARPWPLSSPTTPSTSWTSPRATMTGGSAERNREDPVRREGLFARAWHFLSRC